ncbi:hypothetical protein F5877DRAFT_82265 [Lentinula edodes]|nr:hypothetical protein F5877DRAFT_82265 [Lentinula edodes]
MILTEDTFKIYVKGFISSPTPIPSSGSTPRWGGSARSTTDRQFFYVNGRPSINDIYRAFIPSNATSGQFLFVLANFTISGYAVDVNVTPDKRTILVHAEAELCDRMKDALHNVFSHSRSTYGVSGTQSFNITSTAHNQGMLPFTKSANVQGSVDTQASQAHDIGGAKDDGTVEPGATTSALSYGDVDCRLADICPEEYALYGASADAAEESLGIDDPQISLIPTPSPPSMETLPVPPRTVIMNTIEASWNRPKNSFGEPVNLSMQFPKIAGLAGVPAKSVYPILAQHTKSQMEAPRKKRKSEVANKDHTDEEISGENNPKRQRQTKEVASGGHSVNAKVARLVLMSPQAKFPDRFARKTNQQEMRSQIAGFATSGSRVFPPPQSQFRRPWSPDPYDPYASPSQLRQQLREPSDAFVEALDLADYARTLRPHGNWQPEPENDILDSLQPRLSYPEAEPFLRLLILSQPPYPRNHPRTSYRFHNYPYLTTDELDIVTSAAHSESHAIVSARYLLASPYLDRGSYSKPLDCDPQYSSSYGNDSSRDLFPWSSDPLEYSPTINDSLKAERIRMLGREFGPNAKSNKSNDFLDDNGKPLVGTVDSEGHLVTQGPNKRIATRVLQIVFGAAAGKIEDCSNQNHTEGMQIDKITEYGQLPAT